MQISSAPAFLCSLQIVLPESVPILTRHHIFPHCLLLSCCQDRRPIRPVFVPYVCSFHHKLERTVARAPRDERSPNRTHTVSKGRRKSAHIYLSVKVTDSFETGRARLRDSWEMWKIASGSASPFRGNPTF